MIRIFQEYVFNDKNNWNIKKILDKHENEDKLNVKFIGNCELYQYHINSL